MLETAMVSDVYRTIFWVELSTTSKGIDFLLDTMHLLKFRPAWPNNAN